MQKTGCSQSLEFTCGSCSIVPENLTPDPTPSTPPSYMNHTSDKGLRVLNLNVCSLKSTDKQTQLQGIIEDLNPDIVVATETKLDNEFSNQELIHQSQGYGIFRKDRDRWGGGILIAFRQTLQVILLDLPHECPLLAVRVKVNNQPDLIVAAFYRSPSSGPSDLHNLHLNINSIMGSRLPNIILTGDFNLPSIQWEENVMIDANPQYGLHINELMLDIIDQLGLTQMVLQPTRMGNILDLVLTSVPDLVDARFRSMNREAHKMLYLTTIFTPDPGERFSKKAFSYFKSRRKDTVGTPVAYA